MHKFLPDSLARAREDVYDLMHTKRSRGIVGILAVALLVAFGLWVWPEVQRTIKIHRM